MTTQHRAIALTVSLALFVFLIAVAASTNRTACDAERIDALARGLSYAEGFYAATVTHGDPDTIDMAAANIEATRDALTACYAS